MSDPRIVRANGQGRRCTQMHVAIGSMERARRDDLMKKHSSTIYTRTTQAVISRGSPKYSDIDYPRFDSGLLGRITRRMRTGCCDT